MDCGCIVDDHQNTSIQVPESSPGLENAMSAAVVMFTFLLYNKEHTSIMDSHITTTIYSGSGGGITGDIEIDIGMLQISK